MQEAQKVFGKEYGQQEEYGHHDLLIGKATVVWLSCEKTLETAPMICDPATIRPFRVFKGVH